IGYEYRIARAGRLRHELEGTYLLRYNQTLGGDKRIGAGYYDLGPLPRFKANFKSLWHNRGVGTGAGLNLRYLGGLRECQYNDCKGSAPSRRVEDTATADVHASYTVASPAGKTTVTAGVNNVLDAEPA